jgi:hypothetical protein
MSAGPLSRRCSRRASIRSSYSVERCEIWPLSFEHWCIDAVFQASTASGQNDARSLVVDYNDIDGLTKVLNDNSIDTIISAIQMEGPGVQAQTNLIAAAGKSSKTTRFIPSEYAGFAPDQ